MVKPRRTPWVIAGQRLATVVIMVAWHHAGRCRCSSVSCLRLRFVAATRREVSEFRDDIRATKHYQSMFAAELPCCYILRNMQYRFCFMAIFVAHWGFVCAKRPVMSVRSSNKISSCVMTWISATVFLLNRTMRLSFNKFQKNLNNTVRYREHFVGGMVIIIATIDDEIYTTATGALQINP